MSRDSRDGEPQTRGTPDVEPRPRGAPDGDAPDGDPPHRARDAEAQDAAAAELDAYDFELPPDCIAQQPPEERDGGRMLVLDRASGATHHAAVRALPEWLRPGDLLVWNATRVLPARLRGHKASGGRAEALILGPLGGDRYEALVRCRGRLKPGLKLCFRGGDSGDSTLQVECEVSELLVDGRVSLVFEPGVSPYAVGEAPLPPYIRRDAAEPVDLERYQTVFAREPGAVAAPTAGLHLSEPLLAAIRAAGIETAEVVLHVGAGTFRPLGERELASGRLHEERFTLGESTAAAIDRTREAGGRVVAVGTTTTRVLEACALPGRRVAARAGTTDLFLRPGARFQVVDALLTNFHLPRSSLLLLVCAFAGREPVLRAYREAIAQGYRFYSYGDAMLVL